MADAPTATSSETRLGSGYLRLWLAGTMSNLGDGVTIVALPLLTATVTRDPSVFAGVTLALRLPWLLVALHAGALIDRTDRRKLIGFVNLVRGALVATIGIAALMDALSIPLLYVVAFLLGVGEVFADVAGQVLLPAVVPQPLLERANGRLFGTEVATNQFIGPPLGGLMFAAAMSLPFFFDAGTFVFAAVMILSLHGSFRPRSEPGAARPRIREGLRWLWDQPLIRTLALLGAALNAVWTAGYAVFALLALEVYGVGAFGLGAMLAASGVGYIAGSFSADRLLVGASRSAVLIGAACSSIGLCLAAGGTSSPWVVGVALTIYGFMSALWDVIAVSLRQSMTPDHLFGRVNAAYRFIQWGSMPIGALLGGLAASAFGLQAPWLIGAGVMTVALIASLPSIRRATA